MGLVEVVIAVGLLGTLAAGVVHLFAISARSLALAHHRTSSLMLAADKVEQLRSGLTPRGGVPSTVGGVQTEFLDVSGRLLGGGGAAPSGSRYRRVWSVRRLTGQAGVLVVRVTVVPIRAGPDGGGRSPAFAPDGARLVTLMTAPLIP